MDDDGLNMRNWGYYEPSFKEHIGLQLMSPLGDHRDTKPFISNPLMINPNAGFNHQPSLPMHYIRDSWIQRERLLHMLPGNHDFAVIPDASGSHSGHGLQPNEFELGINVEDIDGNVEADVEDVDGNVKADVEDNSLLNKRSRPRTTTRGKKPKKTKGNGNAKGQRAKVVKWNLEMVINGVEMDISGIPIPVCTCTGAAQQCYRWGSGGWQSACCTTTISMYPLPMSTKRRGARIAGRKMSQGAFKKVLEKLASEAYDFGEAIDLKAYWAKHGTNKFVTIR